jgi:hypothetical protein
MWYADTSIERGYYQDLASGQRCGISRVRILTSIEGILLRRSSIIRYLNSCSAFASILEEINVRAFVEAVVRRVRCRRSVEVVNICKSAYISISISISIDNVPPSRTPRLQCSCQVFAWFCCHGMNRAPRMGADKSNAQFAQ